MEACTEKGYKIRDDIILSSTDDLIKNTYYKSKKA